MTFPAVLKKKVSWFFEARELVRNGPISLRISPSRFRFLFRDKSHDLFIVSLQTPAHCNRVWCYCLSMPGTDWVSRVTGDSRHAINPVDHADSFPGFGVKEIRIVWKDGDF